MGLSRCGELPRIPHFTIDPHLRRRFEIISAENSDSVERLKLRRVCRISECLRKIKTLHGRPVVRRIKANNFGIFPSRLRQQIRIRTDQISDSHPGFVRIAAGTQYVPLKVDSLVVVRSNWKDMNAVAILHAESRKLRM